MTLHRRVLCVLLAVWFAPLPLDFETPARAAARARRRPAPATPAAAAAGAKKPASLPEPAPLDTFAHNGLPPQAAAEAMTLPEGFHATLFAGEPDVQQPIAMAIDDRGRLWVAEAYSYPVRVKPDKARDRILIFEDTDGDGRFDSRKVFIDKLNLVSGLELGFGGVWVGAAPELLFIPDADGDDVPDSEPRVLLDGWGYQDTHETLNAFIWGPDGWLYGCHGVFTHSRVGRPRTPDAERTPINAGIWRYHPTRREFEVFAEGTSNPWGVDFNDRGQCFLTACVIPHLYHVIQSGRYQRQAGSHFNPYTYDDIKTIARHRHWVGEKPHGGNNRSDSAGGGHAHSGAMIYLGGKWPAKYRDQIFMNNIHGARINQDELAANGSGYVGDRAPDFLLANDSWSQLLYFTYGPDGDVYFIDWYDRNQCHHREEGAHDRSNGRIFKVIYDRPTPTKVDLRKLSDLELAELQLQANDWYVRHARRILQERAAAGQAIDPAARARLAEIARTHSDDTRRLRALWALHDAGALESAALLEAMRNDASPYVRGWCVQLACEREPGAQVAPLLAALAESDPSPIVRLYVASALLRLPIAQRAAILKPLLGHGEDALDHNLPLMDWYAAESLVEFDPAVAASLLTTKLDLVRNFLIRRLAQHGAPNALDSVLRSLPEDAPSQTAILSAILAGLEGRRKSAMPASWPERFEALKKSGDAGLRLAAESLALAFGDAAAAQRLSQALQDSTVPAPLRNDALSALLKARAPGLPSLLQSLLKDDAMRGAAIRALAAFDDEATPSAILAVYASLSPAEKRDAVAALAARRSYARQLIDAVEAKQVAGADLSADLVRQLRNLKDADLDRRIREVWGTIQDTPAERLKQMAAYRRMLVEPASKAPDRQLGRALFVKTCAQCHTLFGVGGKIGPELTGSNRADLNYALSNIVDPSAVIGKDYLAHVIVLNDGRVLTGLVRNETPTALTLATATETVVVSKDDIESRELSAKSMMPDDILKPLRDDEVRALIAYLAAPAQTPMLATAENAKTLFNGRDLAGWTGGESLWSVENGEIVGRTTGLQRNEFLVSDLAAEDFRLSLEIKLVEDRGNSGIQFRSETLPDRLVKGYQADVGAGWWGKLYEEHGRGLLWPKSGEQFLRPGDWNRYEIVAVGSRIRTRLNGNLCVDLEDPAGAKRGIFALQLHSGGPTEVRFRDLKLELNPPADAPPPTQ